MTHSDERPPVRLCCGQRHWDAICPDGLVMCALCFDRFEIKDLHVTPDGNVENVCNRCSEMESHVG